MCVHIKVIVHIFDYLPTLEFIQSLKFRMGIQNKAQLRSKISKARFLILFNYFLFKNINL